MVVVYHIQEHTLFVGVDKFENDELIKYAQRYMSELGRIVLWFHADELSSAHSYLVLNDGEKTPDPYLVKLCCQICKTGSKEGCKRESINVIYTPATNLSKNKSVDPGTLTVRGVKRDSRIDSFLIKNRTIVPLKQMNRELDDEIHNLKMRGKAPKAKEQMDEEDFGAEVASLKTALDGVPKEEFDPNMEENFM